MCSNAVHPGSHFVSEFGVGVGDGDNVVFEFVVCGLKHRKNTNAIFGVWDSIIVMIERA